MSRLVIRVARVDAARKRNAGYAARGNAAGVNASRTLRNAKVSAAIRGDEAPAVKRTP